MYTTARYDLNAHLVEVNKIQERILGLTDINRCIEITYSFEKRICTTVSMDLAVHLK